MDQWYKIAKASAMSILFVVGVFVCLLMFQVSNVVYDVGRDEPKIIDRMNTTFDTLNQDCGTIKNIHPCGTLADVAKTLNTARGTMGQIEVAARHVNQSQAVLDAQERGLFADLHETMLYGNGTLVALNQTATGLAGTAQQATDLLKTTNGVVSSAEPLVGHLNDVTISANTSVLEFNKLLGDQSIPAITKNLADITGTGGHMLATADAVETKATYSYLHPSHNIFVRAEQATRPFWVPAAQIGAAVALH
jgi:hypothetical protein